MRRGGRRTRLRGGRSDSERGQTPTAGGAVGGVGCDSGGLSKWNSGQVGMVVKVVAACGPACDRRSARSGSGRVVKSAAKSSWSIAAPEARCHPRSGSPREGFGGVGGGGLPVMSKPQGGGVKPARWSSAAAETAAWTLGGASSGLPC